MGATESSSRPPGSDSQTRFGSAPLYSGLSPGYVRTTAAKRLKALGHPDRLRVVEVLTHRPSTVSEIAVQVGLSLRTTSRHMGILHAAGVVERSHHGNHVLYALADREVPGLAAIAYRGAAAQARRLIATAPKLSETGETQLRRAEK